MTTRMAFERNVSPDPSSGRASPVFRIWNHQQSVDESLPKDKAFRRYATVVERSLSLFETALQEWADYISFLSKLLKSLQARPPNCFQIPSKLIVAKRLAQCLNPTLPSGVHQKALEIYSFIFSMIGKDFLSKDLCLYLPGLSSTLSFASLSVRTPFFELIEKHFLGLNPRSLRPALKALILALLPGLEDETSEEFERTLKLINGFKKAVRPTDLEDVRNDHSSGDEYFWQCFFLASLTCNSRRTGALAYLTRNLPKLGHTSSSGLQEAHGDGVRLSHEDIIFDHLSEIVTSPEPGLLLRCFAAGLTDEQLLTQRGFLDLLVSNLPLHSRVLQKKVKPEDLELLVFSAVGVVSRREMSLNRRLWNWLLGPEVSNQEDDREVEQATLRSEENFQSHTPRTRYFEKFGLHVLVRALLKLIDSDHINPSERARPFKICLSLMDRWEIGGLMITDIFLPIVDSVRRYKTQATTKSDYSEVLRSASAFFDGVESGLIWGEIVRLITQAIGDGKLSNDLRLDKLSLVEFIVTQFNVREEEMLLVHAPLASLVILLLSDNPKDETHVQSLDSSISEEVWNSALQVATDLIELIPERAFREQPFINQSRATVYKEYIQENLFETNILQKIKGFYVQAQGNLGVCPSPLSAVQVSELLIQKAGAITRRTLSTSLSVDEASVRAWLMVNLLSKTPLVKKFDASELLLAMASRLSSPTHLPFVAFTSINYLATTLYTSSYISLKEISRLVEPLVRRAWYFVSASNPKYHVEAVRSLWQLQMALPCSNREIEAAICSKLIEKDPYKPYTTQFSDSARSFGVLWTHTLYDNPTNTDRRSSKVSRLENKSDLRFSCANYDLMLSRPVFLLLDSLSNETEFSLTVKIWLQNLSSIDKLFQLFVTKFSEFGFLQEIPKDYCAAPREKKLLHRGDYDLDQCLYYLKTLSNVLRWSSESMWAALSLHNTSIEIGCSPEIIGSDGEITILNFFLNICLKSLQITCDRDIPHLDSQVSQYHRTSLNVLHQILLCPQAPSLADLQLENFLIDSLMQSLDEANSYVQVLLLDVVFVALKLRNTSRPTSMPPALETQRIYSLTQEISSNSRLPVPVDNADLLSSAPRVLPQNLIKCIQSGLSASSTRPVLDSWISFLTECLQFYTSDIFQILIPLVETLCSQINHTFSTLQKTFRRNAADAIEVHAPETTLISLLNGLENVLARGHDRLIQDESKALNVKSPDQSQGLFGNIVSGVFSSEAPHSRSITANHRLTVLLTFKDAVKICYVIWSWGGDDFSVQDIESASSFNYTSLRMRNRARRLLEHMFAVEALGCLETMVELWRKSSDNFNSPHFPAFFNLLHVLDGSRPKHTIPAIFNAIYSRTNPSSLESNRMSTLTSSLNDTDLTVFLTEYAHTLEDDAMDEIWEDCMNFLKDILSNPFPHRQILPSLLEFAAILGEKADNTNFGEQLKLRRELGDLFIRLLAAVFTTRPVEFLDNFSEADERHGSLASRLSKPEDVVGILTKIVPNLSKILLEPDRVLSAANTICSSVIGPTFKSKSFPDSVSKRTLELLGQITRIPQIHRVWKKDIGDAFIDPRFFASPVDLVVSGWLPILKQWLLVEKDRMPEILSRLVPPATAGIVFGVGASSIRHEADRKAQLNLRRIATLVIAMMEDTFVKELPLIQEKIVELLSATATSSPSSATRAEVFILLRAVVLRFSTVNLASLWPIINFELQAAISSVLAPDNSSVSETYNNYSVVQACKLLDILLCMAPDDFQLHEWLFITDTIDAIYRPQNLDSIALVDKLSEELESSTHLGSLPTNLTAINNTNSQNRKPLLKITGISDSKNWEKRDELVGRVLRPFFSQLSILVFESTYSMNAPDRDACERGLLEDLFDDKNLLKVG